MIDTDTNTVEGALLSLSAVDADHASIQNDRGFNGRDTSFGNSLATQLRAGRTLSANQRAAAYRMLRTYRVQLERDFGIVYADIPAPEKPVASDVTGSARLVGDAIVVSFTGFPGALLGPVKATPNRRYDPATKDWMIPYTDSVVEHLEVWPDAIVLDDALKARVAETRERMAVSAEASRATDAALELEVADQMYPFQRAGVVYAAEHKRTLIADEMGLGKTVQALASLEVTNAYPALVIVPAVVKLNWIREANRWLPHRKVQMLSGRKPYPLEVDADLVIVNYDLLDAWTEAFKRWSWRGIVADESHYLKNSRAKRTKAAKAIAQNIPVRLLLTGTPVLNRPIELAPQLDVLGYLRDFGGFMGFAKRYCGAYQGRFGWDMSGATNLTELHERLRRTCMVRRTKDQVLADLPAKQRAMLPMELADRARYRETERELVRWLKERIMADKEWRARIAAMGPTAEAEAEEMARRKERGMGRAVELVKIEALKQVAAEEKLAEVNRWIADFLESGRKLVVFGTHKHIIAGILEAFPGSVSITGDTPAPKRQAIVDAFQDDPNVRLFVGNTQAAGVGITLTSASDVAFVELPWRPGDLTQAEDRCHRIGQTDSVTAWYLLAAGTIEERIAKMLDTKRAVVDEATDGTAGLDPDDSLVEALIAALMDEED